MSLSIKKRVLNSSISIGSYDSFVRELLDVSKNRTFNYVCVSNVHMLIEAYKDPDFATVVNNAEVVTPDGMPIVKSLQLLYGIKQDRVAGMDLMPDLMDACAKEKMSIFLYGSTEETLRKIKKRAEIDYPGLILYTYSPPFKDLTEKEKKDVIHYINNKKPNFVFVSLGCPKQEKWMAENKDKIYSCLIGLGGAFDVYAGTSEIVEEIFSDKYFVFNIVG